MGLRELFHRPKPQGAQPEPKPVQSPALTPGDSPKPLAPGGKVKAVEIRDLGELIRKRYELDVEIWNLRDVAVHDRIVVLDKMHRSDAVMKKIYATIDAWDGPEAFDARDWRKFQEIKYRVMAGGQRTWTNNPPWID